ncbi:alkaline phosphatase, TIGR02687 family protein|nr:alkaline phosphatase, TIGR02687 family protein [Candidatus Pantoea persica]
MHECETTLSIEQTIIHALVTQLQEESTTLDREAFKKLLSGRQSKYWCQTRQEYYVIDDVLRQAERLLNLRNRHIDGFHYQDSATFWKAYCEELPRFDQAYRLFNEYALLVHSKGAMILKSLDDYIEALYSNWHLAELSRSWNQVLEAENRMQEWRIAGVPRQQNFYNEVVKPLFNNPQIKRVFVTISDALRYEVAEELGNQLNTEKRFTAELRSQLGVLPSWVWLHYCLMKRYAINRVMAKSSMRTGCLLQVRLVAIPFSRNIKDGSLFAITRSFISGITPLMPWVTAHRQRRKPLKRAATRWLN